MKYFDQNIELIFKERNSTTIGAISSWNKTQHELLRLRQIGTNEVVWKPTTEKLYYVKQRCLLVQGAGSLTNISQSQQPKHQSERIQKHSEDF